MLKFLRKNQKWLLVIFCAGLMVAFLVPQAADQFGWNPQTEVIASFYDGEVEVTREDIRRVNGDLETLRRLQIEPLPISPIIPQTGSERNDVLAWLMIQEAAERNGLGASDQAAFDLIATVLGMQDIDSLEEKAKELRMGNANYLLELGRQYLVAEQYRQLVSGVEYTLPEDDDEINSPGLRRYIALRDANELIQRLMQNPQQFAQSAMIMGMTPEQYLEQIMVTQGYIERIQGHERVSANELRYALQRELAELDLTVVVLDADDRLDTTTVDDAYVNKIFDQFADDNPGTGQPYGVGYREPDKVQVEALRIPIDQVREKVAGEILPEDVRKFYNDNRSAFFDLDEPAEGEEPSLGPKKLTFELRDQIRLTLTQIRAQEMVTEIAQKARQRLNEDARGLPDEGAYKKLPEDFKPTPLTQVASEIEAEHGITPEIILVDEFVSQMDIFESMQFSQAWLSKLPVSVVQMPVDQGGLQFMVPRDISEATLGGRAGLFASVAPTINATGRNQLFANYLAYTKAFVAEEEKEAAASNPLQAGLPGAYLQDMTGSTYVFRVTEALPSRPAQELAPIADQVKEDAVRIKAYEDLAAEKDTLLEQAAAQSIEKLMPNADAKTNLPGLRRSAANQRFGASVPGIGSTQPIIQRAFQIADDQIASGGFDNVTEADRLFAVELAGDYKLALVRIDTYRPMTRDEFADQASQPETLLLATTLDMTEPPESALSFEALQRYTDFKWAEGFGDDEDEDEGDEDSEESE